MTTQAMVARAMTPTTCGAPQRCRSRAPVRAMTANVQNATASSVL